MIKLYDKVKIKGKNIMGIIVDIALIDGKEIFTVEDDIENTGKDGRDWPLYQCTKDEIELVE